MSFTEWPDGVTDQLAQRIEATTASFLAERGHPFVVEENRLRVEIEGHAAHLTLWNVAARCAAAPELDAEALVRDFLDQTFAGLTAQHEVNVAAAAGGLDAVRDQLIVQLMQPNPEIADRGTAREDLVGVSTVLMVDLPTTIQSAPPELTTGGDATVDDLFTIALDNLRALFTAEITEVPGPAPEPIRLLTVEPPHDCYIAAQALMLDRYPSLIGTHGTLVAIPCRDLLLAYPAHDDSVVAGLKALAMLAIKAFSEREYALAPHVYWRAPDGAYHTIRLTLDGSQLNIEPDAAVVAMLNELVERV